MMDRSSQIKAHLALLFVTLCYSGNFIIAQDVMRLDFIAPKALVFFRVFGAGALFWMIGRLFVNERLQKKDIPYFLLCSLIGIILAQNVFLIGLEKTPTINASLLISTTPIIVAIFSFLILKERFTSWKVFGLILAAFGAFILISNEAQFEFDPDFKEGNLLILFNALVYGLYLVLIKPLLTKYHPLTVIKWVFTFAMPFIMIISWKELVEIEWEAFNSFAWMGLAYVIIFATFFTYSLNAYGIKKLSPVIAGLYLYLQPLLTTFLSVFFEKDNLDVKKGIAGLLILVGLYFVAFFRKK